MKARHEFREEAILQWNKNPSEDYCPECDYYETIEFKTDELYYDYLRDYAAIHIEAAKSAAHHRDDARLKADKLIENIRKSK
jgi:hypothetical protein